MKKNLLRWKSLSRTILLVALLFTCHNSWAQNSMVEGTVIDAQDGEAIIGALVKIVGTNQAVACDVDGKFNIEAPKDAQLLISFVGYKSQTIAIDQRNNVGTIALEVDAQLIEQVIVTGYGGTTSRSKLTASIASVPNKVLETGAYSNPSAALAGAVPGLAVKTTSGRPGAVSEIILRGGTNLSG
ncbi:MAG: carboxypeptidase-like regulatory domain-containing protein, partial [Mucinivorans sp.]